MAPKDYKRTPRPAEGSRRAKPKKAAPAQPVWLWYLSGVATGVLVSVLVVWKDVTPGKVTAAVAERLQPARNSAAPVPEKAEERADPPRPRFEFYTMLPEMEVAVTERELEPAPPAANAIRTEKSAKPAPAGTYILQAGSFRRLDEAERLKANLAFLGMAAHVQTVVINGENTWHRVRVGPYTDLAVLNEARARLRDNKVEAMVLRIKR